MKEQDAQAKLSLKLQAYQYLKTKILNCEYRPNEFPPCGMRWGVWSRRG